MTVIDSLRFYNFLSSNFPEIGRIEQVPRFQQLLDLRFDEIDYRGGANKVTQWLDFEKQCKGALQQLFARGSRVHKARMPLRGWGPIPTHPCDCRYHYYYHREQG